MPDTVLIYNAVYCCLGDQKYYISGCPYAYFILVISYWVIHLH